MPVDECNDGDVKLEANGTPKFFWSGKWSPICGHWFWNNQEGSKSFCKKLGYGGGTLTKSAGTYLDDAIALGQCNVNEDLESCSVGCNDKTIGNGCIDCRAGEKVSIMITCDGLDAGTSDSSCKGMYYDFSASLNTDNDINETNLAW